MPTVRTMYVIRRHSISRLGKCCLIRRLMNPRATDLRRNFIENFSPFRKNVDDNGQSGNFCGINHKGKRHRNYRRVGASVLRCQRVLMEIPRRRHDIVTRQDYVRRLVRDYFHFRLHGQFVGRRRRPESRQNAKVRQIMDTDDDGGW